MKCTRFGLSSIASLQGCVAALLILAAWTLDFQIAEAVITWDGGGNTSWWFDPVNWSREGDVGGPFLPPSQGQPVIATDAQINVGTGSGEGVVYDPDNDPFFPAANSLAYPTGSGAQPFVGTDFGPQHIWRLYIGRNVTDGNTNKLTIKSGDLIIASTFIIGRSGSTLGNENLGMIIQTGGRLRTPVVPMDIGQAETSGWGNGTYDYRGGTLEVDLEGVNGIRLAHGGGNLVASGKGKFIMHNPTFGGHVRAWRYQSASWRGSINGIGDPADPDGFGRGVATTEFHYENGGTRPIQIGQSLTINNGFQSDTQGTVSSRLDLVLHEAACVGVGCVPNNLGLFDVDFDLGFGSNGGVVTGSGSLGGTFTNIDGASQYTEGSMVSAIFGSTQYNWTISYTGNISWDDAENSVVGSITGAGSGQDVVLLGHSSIRLVPEPGTLLLICTAAISLLTKRSSR
jgi:hypothetical protein